MSTPRLIQKIQQYIDNQEFETAYQILVEEQGKLFKATINREEFCKQGKELIETFLDLTYPIDRFTLNTHLQMECCLRAKEIHARGWDKPDDLLIRIYNYKGYVFNAMRLTDEARACFDFILSICDKHSTQIHQDKMEAYHGIAFGYEEDEEFEMAIRYLKQSEFYIHKATGTPEAVLQTQRGAMKNALACIYTKTNEYDKAIKCSREAISLIGESHPQYFFPVFNLARNLYLKGDYQASLEMFETINERHKDSPELQSRFLPGLADSYTAVGDNEKAEKALLQAADVFDNSGMWHPYIPPVFSRLAQLYLQRNTYAKANFFIEKSLKNCKSFTNRFKSLLIKYDIQIAQNQYLEALVVVQEANEVADQIRLNHQTQSSRLLLAEQTKDLYERGIETAFLLYKKTNDKTYVQTAFRYAEKSKAILLLMEIKHQDGMLSAGMPPDILQREKKILKQLNYLDKMLISEHNLPEEAEKRFKKEQFDLQLEHETFIKKLEQEYPDYHQQKYNTEPTSIKELQEKLSDNRLIINYFIGEKNVYIFQIGKQHADIEKLGQTATIRQQVTNFREQMEDPALMPSDFEPQALMLYDTLLKSTLDRNEADELLIVPDDVLTQLPFEALLTQASNSLIFSKLNYLLNDYEVTYHFSATLWHYGLKKYEKQQQTLSFVGFAPMYEGEVPSERVQGGQYRSVGLRDNLYQLPFAKQEVKQIGDFFKHKKLCIDDVATKENFLAHCTTGNYLHIAAHGFYSKDEDGDCYIQFSPSESEDIKLTINDIASLKIDAHLVVLSCCNTGQGQFRKGESVFALNRSFMAAGGRNVISTLFKVPDALACELMTRMYQKHLKQEKNISPALREAKLQLIMREGVTPMVWCGYQLMGS